MSVPLNDSGPADPRALVAIDLGAESCRVSLLRWRGGLPEVKLVHRFANHARHVNGSLRWDLRMIETGLDDGLRLAAGIASESIRSIAVDGWAVDYVRLNHEGRPLEDSFCYRDERTIGAEVSAHLKCSPERLRELTGVQQLRINTLYQLHADNLAGTDPGEGWLNLPEYILARWGGDRVAELTNASHTGLVELERPQWSAEVFHAVGLDVSKAPKLVPPGTVVGHFAGPLTELPALRDTVLIAPACHDTASAIAGLPATGDDWAYISSGTWSLVGAVLDKPCNNAAARAGNFTNFGGAGGRICFHKNVNGMWLLRQCIEQWALEGFQWSVHELVAEAARATLPEGLIKVDEPDLLLQGDMPARINQQRSSRGLPLLDKRSANAPQFALLIFHSLATRYAEVLMQIAELTGREFKRLFVVGGGSQNALLNRLTAEATGLQVHRGPRESSTHGNLAIQIAVLNGDRDPVTGVHASAVAHWAAILDRQRRFSDIFGHR